jgi:hypothetical protein
MSVVATDSAGGTTSKKIGESRSEWPKGHLEFCLDNSIAPKVQKGDSYEDH